MSRDERYVVLGLAPAREDWFARVGRWSATAALPVSFRRCLSAPELLASVRAGHPISAVLLDATMPQVDRDLLATLVEADVPALVVDGSEAPRDWVGLGAVAVLPSGLSRELLLDALATHATRLRAAGASDRREPEAVRGAPAEAGRLVAVTGPGGTGASTAAIALAQGLAGAGAGRGVVLVDGCLHAEQAVLHDSRDLVPGLQELVDAHRGATPGPEAVRATTFDVPDRGYRLLLGLRRARFWSGLRPRALEVALRSLRVAFASVVVDVDADLEGEDEGGSIDVEERHGVARTTLAASDAVVAVGAPGLKGVYSLVRVLDDLLAFGVPADRIVPAVSRAPRNPRQRAELARAIAELVSHDGRDVPPPLFLPSRNVDGALRDGARLPAPLPQLLVDAVGRVLDRAAPSGEPTVVPTGPAYARVAPGSLGTHAAAGASELPPLQEGGASA